MALLFSIFVSSYSSAQEISNQTEDTPYPTNSAQAWLGKMSHAVKSLNYKISFVVLKPPGADLQPYVWRHGIDVNGVELEQLSMLNGPGLNVVRIGDRISYFEPNVPPYTLLASSIDGPLPSVFFHDPADLSVSYDFVMVGRSRISGRAAQQIRVVSKDKSRYGLSVWLDQETGLLLKMNTVNLKGQLVEQIQVTDIQVTEFPDPHFANLVKAKLPSIVSLRPDRKDFKSPWRFGYLPVGMKQLKRDLHRLSATGEVVEYVMLSDGLINVSIYLQEEGNTKPIDNLVGRVQSDTLLTLQSGPLNITVIGKIPAATASSIATSISRVN